MSATSAPLCGCVGALGTCVGASHSLFWAASLDGPARSVGDRGDSGRDTRGVNDKGVDGSADRGVDDKGADPDKDIGDPSSEGK